MEIWLWKCGCKGVVNEYVPGEARQAEVLCSAGGRGRGPGLFPDSRCHWDEMSRIGVVQLSAVLRVVVHRVTDPRSSACSFQKTTSEK